MKGTVEQIAFGGSGIVRSDGLVIFVPFSAPGDELSLKVTNQKKSHAFAEILSINTPGPSRISPTCPYYGTCAGCQLQHIDYNAQLAAKELFVKDALERIGGIDCPLEPISPSPKEWNYRKHIRLNLRLTDSGFEAGYIAKDFLAVKQCPIFHELGDEILLLVDRTAKELSNQGIKEGSLRLFKIESGYLFAFSFFPYLPENRREIFADFPFPVIMQSPRQKEQFGNIELSIDLDGLKLFYSPFSFLQNNLEQSEKLYKTLVSQVAGNQVLDLYCGIGATSLLLGREGKQVYGIENNAKAIELAKKNGVFNGLKEIEFECRSVEKADLSRFKNWSVVVNPPRTGLDPEALNHILEIQPVEIVYISCMPATLARDLKAFKEASYRPVFAQPFDMFPQTTHVETVAKLVKA